jgi:hypothetical protein
MGRRGVCLPFSDACGPLVFREDALPVLQKELSRLVRDRNWRYVEIRGGPSLQPEIAPRADFLGHSLQFSHDPDELFHRFRDTTRRAIRKALTKNLAMEVLTSTEALGEFYKLHIRTRKRHGVPPQPFAFFEKIHQHLISRDHGFVVLARLRSKAVAGAVFLRDGSKAIYKFAASNAEFATTRANNLVLWEGIRHLISCGCELLDFGRTSLANHGLRRFKLSWGAEEQMIPYYRIYAGRSLPLGYAPRETGFHNQVFHNLPLALNRLAGAMVYPHLD